MCSTVGTSEPPIPEFLVNNLFFSVLRQPAAALSTRPSGDPDGWGVISGGLAGAWLSLYKLSLKTIKGAFLEHSCFKDDPCLCLCAFGCLNLQALAWLTNGPVVQVPQKGVVPYCQVLPMCATLNYVYSSIVCHILNL